MRFKTLALALLATALLTSPVMAQVVTSGTIVVTVLDQDGQPLPGVTVTVRATDSVTTREAVSDGQGVARLPQLAPSADYVIEGTLAGFATVHQEEVLVRTGQTTNISVTLRVGGIDEVVTVTALPPVVDLSSSITGQDITLELTEALPTGRSYQSYLQLVPGVLPTDENSPGNPASKSGLNYRDIFGDNGVSRDNSYYIDGINVTDPVTGTFGANLNTEIIQEQQVITGGISAEYNGTPGLLSSVVTKSGSNQFHGSANYFFQNDSLFASNENFPDSDFSTFDTAVTFGGPIAKDRAWFFGSYRRLEREDTVVNQDTLAALRTVDNNSNQWYARATVSPFGGDSLAFTFLNDPTSISGSNDRTITNLRDRSTEQGGNNYTLKYSNYLTGTDTLVDLAWNKHNGEVSTFAAVREARNDVIFEASDVRTIDDEQLGGAGSDSISLRDTESYKAGFQQNFDNHEVKFGVEFQENSNLRDRLTVGGATYQSLQPGLAGLTAGELDAGDFTAQSFNPNNTSDFNGLVNTINASPDFDAFMATLDSNGDGVLTPQEVGDNMVFDSTAGNPNGKINYDRTAQTQDGAQDTGSEGLTFYAQDTVNITDRLVVNAGFRTERFEHFATTGENIFTFDWTFAPRVSAIYDLFGDGKHSLSVFYGKYYDPIRNNLTNFAGTLGGAIREEQVFLNDQWVTYRTRGGPQVQDALFAPSTKTPFTDDLQFSYQTDLGNNISLEAIYTHRRTRDIIEDYDMALYAFLDDGSTAYPGPVDHPDSLFLGLDYFGYTSFPDSNFVIATLAGGTRDYDGIEMVLRKRFSDNWQGLFSYSFNDASGNTNSDSNADFQGDVLWLDPRSPNQAGNQPGSIEHLIKVYGSYAFDNGLQLGGTFNWNSGTISSRTFRASRRNLPLLNATSTEFAGITRRWLDPTAVGTLENPSFGIFDARVQYNKRIGGANAELFVDIFNVFNEQGATRNEDLIAGTGDTSFGEGIRFSIPRRLFLGARLSF